MPHDHEFPGDCDQEHDEDHPDPDGDQDTLTGALDALDGLLLDGDDGGAGIVPFRVRPSESKIYTASGNYQYSEVGTDGIAFAAHTMRWGHHTGGTRYHPRRVAFNGGGLVTLSET